MRFELLANKQQFENLKKGDCILVEWTDYWVKHHQEAKKVMLYYIHENKETHEEIICQTRYNHYFNYDLYLAGTSCAELVYKIKQ